jgi:hypothetical protein
VTWAPDYCTSAELKSYINSGGMSGGDNADDAFIALWVATVSRNIDDHCGRQFGQVASAEDRYYTPKYDSHELAWIVEIDDLQDTTGLTVADKDGVSVSVQSSTVDGYTLLPRNAATKGKPYERLKLTVSTGELTVHGKWGWSAVPSSVKTGIFLQGKRLAKRRDSPFGIAGSPQEQGVIRLLAQLDPDFRTSLKPFVRNWWAA